MSNRRVKRKRSKALVLALLPALIFIGIVGWLISSIEPSHKKTNRTHNKAPKAQNEHNDGLTFIPAIYEENNEITTR